MAVLLAGSPSQALAALDYYEINGVYMGYKASSANGATSVWPTYYMQDALVCDQARITGSVTGTNTYNLAERWYSSGSSSSTQPAYRFYDSGGGTVATIIPSNTNWQVITGNETVTMTHTDAIQGGTFAEVRSLRFMGNSVTSGTTTYVSFMVSFGNSAALNSGDRIVVPLMMRPDVSESVYIFDENGVVNTCKHDGGSATVVQFAYMTSDNVWRRYNSLPSGYLDVTEPVYMVAYVVKITGTSGGYDGVAFDRNTFKFTRMGESVDSSLGRIEDQLAQLNDTSGSGGIVSGVTGQYGDKSTYDNNLGALGDGVDIATGWQGAITNVDPNSKIRFDGIQLGADFGYFEIPAFEVDFWQYIPEGVATTIKAGFTGVAILAWATGLKKFYDRVFHGEQVVTVD